MGGNGRYHLVAFVENLFCDRRARKLMNARSGQRLHLRSEFYSFFVKVFSRKVFCNIVKKRRAYSLFSVGAVKLCQQYSSFCGTVNVVNSALFKIKSRISGNDVIVIAVKRVFLDIIGNGIGHDFTFFAESYGDFQERT